ncbi:hypothetical protein PL321_08875 [Caloramator sp. mosi_1]|nr:hypothetical protein [Caloramator sp. mosi_1]WDC85425.1 hypothetical protein PL321_08875 [Caloramator sp. mosi_1]
MIRDKRVDFSKVYSNLNKLKDIFSKYKDKVIVAYLLVQFIEEKLLL